MAAEAVVLLISAENLMLEELQWLWPMTKARAVVPEENSIFKQDDARLPRAQESGRDLMLGGSRRLWGRSQSVRQTSTAGRRKICIRYGQSAGIDLSWLGDQFRPVV